MKLLKCSVLWTNVVVFFYLALIRKRAENVLVGMNVFVHVIHFRIDELIVCHVISCHIHCYQLSFNIILLTRLSGNLLVTYVLLLSFSNRQTAMRKAHSASYYGHTSFRLESG